MTQLIISERLEKDFVVLDLKGNITFGEATKTLREAVRQLISDNKKKISLNLKDVSYVDSAGIGEFISTLTAINRERGGQLKILNPTERIYKLLEISKLLSIFDITYSEESAVSG